MSPSRASSPAPLDGAPPRGRPLRLAEGTARLIAALLFAVSGGCAADTASRISEDAAQETTSRRDASGDPRVIPDDGSGASDGSGDDADAADVPDVPTSGGAFGDPCADDSECSSGYCVLDGDARVCTEYCNSGSCAEGWTCRELLNSGSDAVRICVPERDSLCAPCETNLDCGGFGDDCVRVGESSFCGRNCEVTRECPTGYLCDPAFSVEGGTSRQCLPASGVCSCPPDMYGESRDCVRANAEGICRGVEVCEPDLGWSRCTAPTPNAELCDGLDNDCDNLIDEGLVARPCSSTPNPLGSCPGTETCGGAAGWSCNAPAASIELCDGLDNDCNGTIDDGLCYDGNPCTRDLCDPISGGCSFPPFSGPCDDGSLCTTGELCVAGACTGSPVNCDDGNDCTADSCDATTGCRHTPANGAPCETGNFCTSDTCSDGLCTPGRAVDCGTPSVCLAPSCDPAVGCTTTRLSGNRCDDDDACTVNDTCSNGTCIGGTPACQGRPCSNCSGSWNLSFGGTCLDLAGSPICLCICL